MNFKGRSFLTITDFNKEEIRFLIDYAGRLKLEKKEGVQLPLLKGKNVVLIFEKSLTRMRSSFQVAAFDEGANVTYLSNSHMSKKESIEDSARVFSRIYDAIEYQGYRQNVVEELVKYADIPVWNRLTDPDHPTQVIADFMTIEDCLKKPLDQIQLTYVGNLSNKVMNMLMCGCAIMGMSFKAVGPLQTKIDKDIFYKAMKIAETSGGRIEISHDVNDIRKSDVIYSSAWVNPNEPDKIDPAQINALLPFKITEKLLRDTDNQECLFMHCLPSYHNFDSFFAKDIKERLGLDICEVENSVFCSEKSAVFDEVENRTHSIRALMSVTLGEQV